ncbi:hypothetical protein H0X09_00615 [Candidatus Saccharibacteria bacterium]|nr:hypothetical protein [Candidatus Saccharibacteria bacterium]
MTDFILGVLILAPLALTFFLKSNAGLGFMALCTGFVLSTSVVGDLKQLLNQMDLTVTESSLAITIIVLPFLLTLLLVRSSSKKGIFFILQLTAAICAGGLLALSISPLIPASLEFNLKSSSVWDVLQGAQAAVIGLGALFSFLVIWLGGFQHNRKKKH